MRRAVSSAHGEGIDTLLDAIIDRLILTETIAAESDTTGIRIAVVSRPNAGKSTLVNRILGDERMVVCDKPGTTRDSIFIPFRRDQRDYVLIDTARIRRRSRVTERCQAARERIDCGALHCLRFSVTAARDIYQGVFVSAEDYYRYGATAGPPLLRDPS